MNGFDTLSTILTYTKHLPADWTSGQGSLQRVGRRSREGEQQLRRRAGPLFHVKSPGTPDGSLVKQRKKALERSGKRVGHSERH